MSAQTKMAILHVRFARVGITCLQTKIDALRIVMSLSSLIDSHVTRERQHVIPAIFTTGLPARLATRPTNRSGMARNAMIVHSKQILVL